MEVRVYQDEVGEYRWQLRADNGEIFADSAEGYRHEGYAITTAEKLNPNAQLVVDDTRRASPPRLQRLTYVGLAQAVRSIPKFRPQQGA